MSYGVLAAKIESTGGTKWRSSWRLLQQNQLYHIIMSYMTQPLRYSRVILWHSVILSFWYEYPSFPIAHSFQSLMTSM